MTTSAVERVRPEPLANAVELRRSPGSRRCSDDPGGGVARAMPAGIGRSGRRDARHSSERHRGARTRRPSAARTARGHPASAGTPRRPRAAPRIRQLRREPSDGADAPYWAGRRFLGSDFVQLARLLVDGYVDIRLAQERAAASPPSPRSDNGDVQCHGDPPDELRPSGVASATGRDWFFPNDL